MGPWEQYGRVYHKCGRGVLREFLRAILDSREFGLRSNPLLQYYRSLFGLVVWYRNFRPSRPYQLSLPYLDTVRHYG